MGADGDAMGPGGAAVRMGRTQRPRITEWESRSARVKQ
jgi:hypothetical protein